MTSRRFEYNQARHLGDKLAVFVKWEASNWEKPIVTLAEVAEEFDWTESETLEKLQANERVTCLEVGDTWVAW